MATAIAEVCVPKDVDPLSKQYGAALRAIRREKGIPHRELAARLGIAESTYRSYEQGYRRIRLDQIPRFAAAFGVTVEELTARLGRHDLSAREIRLAEFTDLAEKLADEDVQVADTIIRMANDILRIAQLHEHERPQERDN